MTAIMEWGAYCIAVSVVLASAAWVGERAAGELGRPARGYWFGALVLSMVVPLMAALAPAWRIPEAVPLLPALTAAAPALMLDPVSTGPAESGLGSGAVLLSLWALATLVLGVRWLASMVVLGRQRRRWSRLEMEGVTVLRSAAMGPAVVGVRRPQVVLPAWAFEVDARLRRLMVLHEWEHVRARDPWLLLGGRVLAMLVPWNPALWWMLRRLRLAVELDCDARVVRGTRDAQLYGTALYEAGRRQAGPALAIAFSEPTPWLERRLRRLLRGGRRRPLRGVGLAALALALLALAVSARDPLSAAPESGLAPTGDAPVIDDIRAPVQATDGAVLSEIEARLGRVRERIEPSARLVAMAGAVFDGLTAPLVQDTQQGPVFTPYEVAPALLNAAQVHRAMDRLYPALLRNSGIGGSVVVWFYIDEAGAVRRTRLQESSGYPTLDEAALKLANVLRFEPARNRGRRVAVWVAIPITFTADRDGAIIGGTDPRSEQRVREQTASRTLRERSAAGARDPRTGSASGPPALTPMYVAGAVKTHVPSTEMTGEQLAERPVFTPYTVKPELLNVSDVQRALERSYPALLRNAGIGGDVIIWFFIDETGRVRNTDLHDSSGYATLDEAALSVAQLMQFRPAFNGDEPVPVWIAIPIKFDTK